MGQKAWWSVVIEHPLHGVQQLGPFWTWKEATSQYKAAENLGDFLSLTLIESRPVKSVVNMNAFKRKAADGNAE